MKKIILCVIALFFALVLGTCAMGDSAESGSYSGSGDGGDRSFPSWDGSSGDSPNEKPNKPSAGQLTCGEWSDIKNYDFYLNLFINKDDPEVEDDSEFGDAPEFGDIPEIKENQKRKNYSRFIGYFGFETRYMVTVNVVNGENPVNDASVELYDSQAKLFTAKTDMRGNAFLFPKNDLDGKNITVKVKSGTFSSEETIPYTGEIVKITLENSIKPESILDLMFVIDTTGSMGDELNYLKSEIDDVIGKISKDNQNLTVRLALLFYRDFGDEYVTRYFNFSTDIKAQQANLARQRATGGGDFPEAADVALKEAVEKNWSDNSVRLIFHVCDARPHTDKERQGSEARYFNAIKSAAEKGIRIIPVASSGIDLATEFLLRQEAIMTGGTYIFLTDDSGIGEPHLEPTVGEFTVEYLNACMIRVVNEYLTGIATDPVSYY